MLLIWGVLLQFGAENLSFAYGDKMTTFEDAEKERSMDTYERYFLDLISVIFMVETSKGLNFCSELSRDW